MSDVNAVVDRAILEIDNLKKNLRKKTNRQVRSIDEQSLIRSTALAWLNDHRKIVLSTVGEEAIHSIDEIYKSLVSASYRASGRKLYLSYIGNLRKELSQLLELSLSGPALSQTTTTPDTPPDFSILVRDAQMKSILEDRWKECVNCIDAGAPLAATVMMGGLLEALLLARVNIEEPNKSSVFKAKGAPKKNNKPLELKSWTLGHYIDVAHELGWITQPARDVGEVLRDYRNYIHPSKQLSHGITLSKLEVTLFWEISKFLSKQLIEGIK